MAAIYLIRHGQASFGSADYDQLSAKGAEQASILGQYWRNRHCPKKIYCGDLLRHGQTLSSFNQGYQKSVAPTVIHSGFNEFDHVDILQQYNSKWIDFKAASKDINNLDNANKIFQQEFAQALNRWISGEFDPQYHESWPSFKARCIRALQNIIDQELAKKRQLVKTNDHVNGPKDILVFTSGGTISVIVQHILKLNDQQALTLNQQSRNTSVTKLLFSENLLSVDYFNNFSHLEQRGEEWITFR